MESKDATTLKKEELSATFSQMMKDREADMPQGNLMRGSVPIAMGSRVLSSEDESQSGTEFHIDPNAREKLGIGHGR